MTRPFICVGDTLDHGGTVATGSPFTEIQGRSVARVGDRVVCSKHGPTTIASGDATIIIDGQAVARHGDKTACGATLISRQVLVFVDVGVANDGRRGAGGTALKLTRGADSLTSAGFDEAFVLKSAETNEPLAHRRYRIVRADGSIEEGATDEAGATHLVVTDMAEALTIELGEEVVA